MSRRSAGLGILPVVMSVAAAGKAAVAVWRPGADGTAWRSLPGPHYDTAKVLYPHVLVQCLPARIVPAAWSPRPADRPFVANLRRDLFDCFNCKAGGTQLDLWSAHTQVSLYDAALDLCHRHGITPPRKSS